ncbi:ectonucleoside triphosphate diphosphohydrolase 1 isoform X5 [Lepisosteus oculatus]|uniref:ectonucleoside triphosphate diphosphohydrolase 1 isoform X5 n=1 Tax=Lepisosteus oculatus TaxID=7918 RepID=UPI003716BAFA
MNYLHLLASPHRHNGRRKLADRCAKQGPEVSSLLGFLYRPCPAGLRTQLLPDVHQDCLGLRYLGDGSIFLPRVPVFWDVRDSLEINMRLQKEVQEFGTRNPAVRDLPPAAPIIPCDHCIDANLVAVKTCLTCDASLCAAHLELHLNKAAFLGHTIIKVTGNPFSLKCAEHREELKLYCQEDGISVCSLCVVIGSHKNHRVVTSQEACTEMKKIMEENINKLMEMCQLAEETMRGMDSLFSEVSQRATSIKERICGKYRRLKMLIEEDEDLIMRILESEERYSLKWLLSKKEALECQINEMDAIVNTSTSLIQEEDGLAFLQISEMSLLTLIQRILSSRFLTTNWKSVGANFPFHRVRIQRGLIPSTVFWLKTNSQMDSITGRSYCSSRETILADWSSLWLNPKERGKRF